MVIPSIACIAAFRAWWDARRRRHNEKQGEKERAVLQLHTVPSSGGSQTYALQNEGKISQPRKKRPPQFETKFKVSDLYPL